MGKAIRVGTTCEAAKVQDRKSSHAAHNNQVRPWQEQMLATGAVFAEHIVGLPAAPTTLFANNRDTQYLQPRVPPNEGYFRRGSRINEGEVAGPLNVRQALGQLATRTWTASEKTGG